MSAKTKLVERCKTLGVMLLDDGDVLRIDAPVGYTFGAGVHSRDIDGIGRRWKRDEAYAELLATLAAGLLKCDDPDCDACIHEPMTFDEIHSHYRGQRLA